MRNQPISNYILRQIPVGFILLCFLASCCKPKQIPECESAIIQQFIDAKQQDLLLPPLVGNVTKGGAGFYAFQSLSVENQNYQSSIEVVGNCSSGTLWLGWMDINANLQPKWYQYNYSNCDGKFSFVFVPEQNFKSPTYPYYMSVFRGMSNVRPRPTGAWSEFDDYDAWYIPHWSPIIDGNHTLIDDIHKSYNEGSAESVTGYLNDAKPYNGQDLEDRTITGWESVTMRGIVNKAAHPYGDLDIDHLKACKETYGGIPAEIVYPEKGADWDMYINPDPDMGYLNTDAKPNEVGCEIEDWTLRDDNRFYRPKTGDYLQTIGKWCTDCGHPIFGNLHNGFFTEIHPPEILVASKYVGGITTAKIIGTGAFKNNSHQFMVWPGPRPSPYHTLKWEVLHEAKENMSLQLTALPAGNPNHLVGKISRTGGDNLQIDDEGVVYQRCQVIYKAHVKAYWKDERKVLNDNLFAEAIKYVKGIKASDIKADKIKSLFASNGYVNVVASVLRLPENITGSIKYRIKSKEQNNNAHWQQIELDHGKCSLSLYAGTTYEIIPVVMDGIGEPQKMELTINEEFINHPSDIVFTYKPIRRGGIVRKISKENLLTLYSPTDVHRKKLAPILGQLFMVEDAQEIYGRIVLHNLLGKDGQILQDIDSSSVEQMPSSMIDEIAKRPTPYILLAKDTLNKQVFLFNGSFKPMDKPVKAKIIFYSGNDANGYQQVYEKEISILSSRANMFSYQPRLPYFAGRVGVEVLEGEGNFIDHQKVLSSYFAWQSNRDSILEEDSLQVMYNKDKRIDHQVLISFEKNIGEYLHRLRMNSHENKNLWKRKVKKVVVLKDK